ncbi:prolactin-like [Heterodontus francisci]|uniref:prolactin-like n=1 Tax=Heterodontus francisci TaxID=7792 RepID=UPI00355ADDEC
MALPTCANGHGECQTISISELFDRAIQHFMQGQHLIFSVINSCHTSSIATPQNKEDALRTSRERLLNLVIDILSSWQDPLQYMISEFSDAYRITSSILNKSVKIPKQMKQLAKGLNKISEQVGQHRAAIQQRLQWEQPLTEDGPSVTLQLYSLLHCFRRDTHKIDSYLKLLKCRFSQ